MSKLQGYIRPVNFSARDSQLYKHLRSGAPLTSQRLLEMDYGGKIPKGVHATEQNNKPVSIKSIFADKATPLPWRILTAGIMSLMAAGYVRAPEPADPQRFEKPFDRSIYMNNLMFSPVGQAGISYIGMGVVKAASLTLGILASPVTFLKAFGPMLVMSASSLRLAPLIQMGAFIWRAGMDTIGHEHIHVLQSDDSLSKKTGFDALRNDFKTAAVKTLKQKASTLSTLDKFASLGMTGYFMNDYEVQARLHVTMVHGARRWGRLPETKHELWGALIDSGLSAPASIHRELKHSPERGVRDFYRPSLRESFNAAARVATDPSSAELNVAYRAHILPELKEKFWTDTLPYLYGHMIELYGDENGRRKMGYDPEGPAPVPANAPAAPRI